MVKAAAKEDWVLPQPVRYPASFERLAWDITGRIDVVGMNAFE